MVGERVFGGDITDETKADESGMGLEVVVEGDDWIYTIYRRFAATQKTIHHNLQNSELKNQELGGLQLYGFTISTHLSNGRLL